MVVCGIAKLLCLLFQFWFINNYFNHVVTVTKQNVNDMCTPLVFKKEADVKSNFSLDSEQTTGTEVT